MDHLLFGATDGGRTQPPRTCEPPEPAWPAHETYVRVNNGEQVCGVRDVRVNLGAIVPSAAPGLAPSFDAAPGGPARTLGGLPRASAVLRNTDR